jgi:hypothetical protein
MEDITENNGTEHETKRIFIDHMDVHVNEEDDIESSNK